MSIIERTGYRRRPKVPLTNEQRKDAWEAKYKNVPLEMQIDSSSSADLQRCEFCGHSFDKELLGRYGCPNCEGEGECTTDSN